MSSQVPVAPPTPPAAIATPPRQSLARRLAKDAEAAVVSLLAAAVRLRARDITARAQSTSALILAPHPDDETLGCGATIVRKRAAGHAVRVVVATDGRHSHRSPRITPDELAAIRQTETLLACAELGVPGDCITFLAFEDGRLADHAGALRDRLLAIIREFRPQEIYIPSPLDRHPDHRALHAAAADLARAGHIQAAILEYPVWFYSAATWIGPRCTPGAILRAPFRMLRAALTLSPRSIDARGLLDRKAAALAHHGTQARGIAGDTASPSLDPRFLAHFFRPREIFFATPQPGAPHG